MSIGDHSGFGGEIVCVWSVTAAEKAAAARNTERDDTHPSILPLRKRQMGFWNMLKSACSDYGRHCSEFGEQNHNVFSRPSNTLPVCVTDENGSFGSGVPGEAQNGESEFVVEFEYQVQTTLSQTVARLRQDDSALSRVERAISDAVVESLFSGNRCTVPPATSAMKSGEAAEDNGPGATRRRKATRALQYSYYDQLTGFREDPQDQVVLGSEGSTCGRWIDSEY